MGSNSEKSISVWVFGYGSLIWDHSEIPSIEERDGWLEGWHRDWTMISMKRRHGAPTCNLQPGGKVKGKFFKLAPKKQEATLADLREREGRSEEVVHLDAFDGEVHFWTMVRNLEKHYDTNGLEGQELYQFIAKIAHGITLKGPDNKTATEYAFAVHAFDPDDKITKMYVDEIFKLSKK